MERRPPGRRPNGTGASHPLQRATGAATGAALNGGVDTGASGKFSGSFSLASISFLRASTIGGAAKSRPSMNSVT